MKRALLHVVIAISAVLLAMSTFGQQGSPLIVNYPPSSYSHLSKSAQNWGIVQDTNGILLVGNSSGVLTFDGKTWRIIPETRNKLFFKFARDSKGVIYTGGLNELGYFVGDSVGNLRYKSLCQHLPDSLKEFGRAISIAVQDDKLFFQTKEMILEWDGTSFSFHDKAERYYKVFSTSAGVFAHLKPQGLSKLKHGNFVAVSDDLEFTKRIIKGILPLNEQGTDLLVATKYNGIYKVNKKSVIKLNTVLDSVKVLNTAELSNDNWALSTDGNGIYILDSKAKVVQVIDENIGLRQNQVTFPFVDMHNGLWACLYSGISRIEYPSTLSYLGKEENLNGVPLCAANFKDRMYLGSSEGGFYVDKEGGESGKYKLHPSKWKTATIWEFEVFEDRLLISMNNGLWQELSNGTTEQIASYEDALVTPVPGKKDHLFVGNRFGVGLIKLEDGKWQDHGVIAEVGHQISTMAMEKSNFLWVSRDKISCLDFSNGLTEPVVTTLDSTQGFVEEMGICEATRLGDEVVFATDIGLYKFDHEQNRLVPDARFGKHFCDGSTYVSDVSMAEDGTVWLSTGYGVGPLKKVDDIWVMDTLLIKRAPKSDIHSIFHHPDGTTWILATEGAIRYDPSMVMDYSPQWKALIRSVYSKNDSLLFNGHQSELYVDPILNYASNQVSFTYAAGYFEAPEKILYSHQLEGQDSDWSPWHSTVSTEYTNLSEGEYTFKVKAKNIYGSVSSIATYSFSVLPPWYRTNWAWGAWIVLGILSLVGIVRLNTFRLIRAKEQLEKVVEERTTEIRQQKDEIEEQKEEIEELLEAKEEALFRAEASEKAKELFLANMSHEIRTPLNAVLGFTEIMRREEHSERQGDFLETIQNSGENLLVIINDILDFSKIEAGKLEIESIAFDLRKSFRTCEAMLRPKAEEKGLELEVEIDSTIPDVLMGDPVRLSQILVNLVNNAIKFTEQGKVTVKAKLEELKGDVARIELAITDTGIGIPKEKVNAIFDSFTQASTDTSRKYGGTGLGTTIVKRLVDLQDGHVSVESEMGVGSTFSVVLPYKVSDMKLAELSGSSSKDFAPKRLIGKVLVADDNKTNRKLAFEVLTSFGLEAEFAVNGKEVLEMHQSEEYDLILMDLQMPEMDGIEATVNIRTQFEGYKKNIPIIGMTAHFMAEDGERCMKAGMQNHVAKPFRQEELYRVLLEHLVVDESTPPTTSDKAKEPMLVVKSTELLNLNYLIKLSKGRKDFLVETLRELEEETTSDIERLNELFSIEDVSGIRKLAHKSSSGLVAFGNQDLVDLFISLDEMSQDNNGLSAIGKQLSAIDKLWKRIRTQVHLVIEELR